jgi:hypothetical protein
MKQQSNWEVVATYRLYSLLGRVHDRNLQALLVSIFEDWPIILVGLVPIWAFSVCILLHGTHIYR